MRKLYYIGFYGDPDPTARRKITPAADAKMSYIIESLKKIGYEVEVVSFCIEDDRTTFFRRKPGYEILRDGTRVVFFDNYTSKYRVLRAVGMWLSWQKIKKYLKEYCLGDDSKILIYHALGFLKVIRFFSRRNKKFILEVEEIYGDVLESRIVHNMETRAAQRADGYVFPTKLLNEKVNTDGKPSIIIHGTYKVEPQRECNLELSKFHEWESNTIHCVYAGVFDPRKGGAAAAAAEFLPFGYHIHIIGFGSDEEKKLMQDKILEIAKKTPAKITFDGLLTGEDYIRFLQNCDIGLCTQNPDALFNATSFPSKILSYMANGLRVVSIRIPVIEQSAVGDMLYFYDEQTPEKIAKAILSVNMQADYDSRNKIRQLDEKFQKDLTSLLEG